MNIYILKKVIIVFALSKNTLHLSYTRYKRSLFLRVKADSHLNELKQYLLVKKAFLTT